MAKKQTFGEELEFLKQFLIKPQSESAKRHLVYPLFKKMFPEKFKIESQAEGADIYIDGKLIIELKTSENDWLQGFYQALHYQKKGLSFAAVCVISEKFIALWKVHHIPEFAVALSHLSDASLAPNAIGKINAQKTSKTEKEEILQTAFFKLTPKDIEISQKELRLLYEVYEFLNVLQNLEADRIQINTFNFLEAIEQLKQFFDDPMDAIHCFYAFVGYWDITSTIAENEYHEGLQMVGYKGKKISESVLVSHKHRRNFKKFIENHFVFTNQGSGLTADYYFSRFDEVIVKLNPEYAKQHGIFFTDDKLSRFAHWFIEEKIIENVGENYIIVDPAAGSGNLIANYKGKLKHKIVSDYQPDLLRTIERRMRVDPYHRESGFTIIPKVSENKGLNFLDKSATDYLAEIEKALHRKNLKLDQAFAFLLNPPYKNTDQHAKFRQNNEANYEIHEDILALTGQDAGKERYLAFLAQILLICKEQNARNDEHLPLLMIFTPTSWLIPRPSYEKFREIFDTYFEYKAGFITTSNEFFKLEGRWAVAFTVWQFRKPTENAKNKILLHDFSALTRRDLFFDWDEKNPKDFKKLRQIFLESKIIKLHNSRGDIRETLPFLKKKDKSVRQSRYNMYRNWSVSEKNEKIVSGFPLKDDRHQNYNVPYGFAKANFVGFMEDNTPVRLAQDSHKRMSHEPNRVWFMLMSAFSSVNLSQIHSGAANSRSYCAYDLKSAQALFAWFGISKAVNGRYPVWANQYDLWKIDFGKSKRKSYFYSLCYAYALAENRCVQTVFEKNNPVADAPEVFVDNPLCPANSESFWNTVLDSEISQEKIDLLSENEVIFDQNNLALALVEAVKNLYRFWNSNYCQAQTLRNVGLENETYFKYFAYSDFVSPFSGLIQIKKYAEVNLATDLAPYFEKITDLSKLVKEEIYEFLINEFGYFD